MGKFSDKLFADRTELPDVPESDSPAQAASGGEEPAASQEASETPAAEAKPAEPTKPEPKKPEPTTKPEGEDEQEHVPDDLEGLKRALAAARGDKRKARSKWQEAEKALAELTGQIKTYQQMQARPQPQPVAPQAPQAPQPVDLTEERFFGNGPAAVKEYVAAKVKAEREELLREVSEKLLPQSAQQVKEQFSEAAARRRYQDFEAKLALWRQIATPRDVEAARTNADPYEYAYQFVTVQEQLKDTPTLDALKEKLRTELRAELEAEMASRGATMTHEAQPTIAAASHAPAPSPAKTPVPKSLAGARGSGAGVTQEWTGPKAFERLFPQ